MSAQVITAKLVTNPLQLRCGKMLGETAVNALPEMHGMYVDVKVILGSHI